MTTKKNKSADQITRLGIPWKAEQNGRDGSYTLKAGVDFRRALVPIRDWTAHKGATKAVINKLEAEAFSVILSLTEHERANSSLLIEGKERAKMIVHEDGTKTAEIVKAADRGTSPQRVRGEVHMTANMVVAQANHATEIVGYAYGAELLVRWCTALGIEITNTASA